MIRLDLPELVPYDIAPYMGDNSDVVVESPELAADAFSSRVRRIASNVGVRVALAFGAGAGVVAYNDAATDVGSNEVVIAAQEQGTDPFTDHDVLQLVSASLSPYCKLRNRVDLSAHRGITDEDGTKEIGGVLYTENTPRAAVKGINMGADIVEFDNWLTLDGESAVYHNTLLGHPDVDPNMGGRVDSHNYYGDLDKAKLPSGAILPTNSQIVQAVDTHTNQGGLQVELKLTRGGPRRKTAWITGMVTTAQEYQANNPRASVGFTSSSTDLLKIVDDVSGGTMETALINFGRRVIPVRTIARFIDGINNGPHTRGLDRNYVWNAADKGVEIGVRSVNTPKQFQRFAGKVRVHRIITDNPKAVNNGC